MSFDLFQKDFGELVRRKVFEVVVFGMGVRIPLKTNGAGLLVIRNKETVLFAGVHVRKKF